MEEFMISPYNFGQYQGCGPIFHGNPKFKPHWAKKGGLYVPPDTLDYLDLCKRAQLKAILSQINPNLTPRLRKANTKEFGVQVNSKVDAVVQCSLGPKTLFYRERTFPSFPKSPIKSPAPTTPDGKVLPSTPVNNVRFSRPLAIYSPVFDRRFFAMSLKSNDSSACEDGEQDGNHFGDDDAEADQTIEGATEDTREDVRKPLQPPVPKAFNFQFLEQKYGFFHCSKCNIRWESAYVWCISATSKVYFKQLCRKCRVGINPYRVETIQCQVCSQARCCCEQKQRHIDMKRPHRQDLCGRCKGKRLSCHTTYSFKYIV